MTWTVADTQFYLILAATAVAIAVVVLVYSRISLRRSRAAEAKRDATLGTASSSSATEPVFFTRYTIDE